MDRTHRGCSSDPGGAQGGDPRDLMGEIVGTGVILAHAKFHMDRDMVGAEVRFDETPHRRGESGDVNLRSRVDMAVLDSRPRCLSPVGDGRPLGGCGRTVRSEQRRRAIGARDAKRPGMSRWATPRAVIRSGRDSVDQPTPHRAANWSAMPSGPTQSSVGMRLSAVAVSSTKNTGSTATSRSSGLSMPSD